MDDNYCFPKHSVRHRAQSYPSDHSAEWILWCPMCHPPFPGLLKAEQSSELSPFPGRDGGSS